MTTVHECRDRSRMLGSYLDGELEPAMILELDEHVTRCDTCREEAQLLRAMRGSLKRVVKTSAPAGLRDRMAAAMTAERAREDARVETASSAAGKTSWRTMVPLATAAALALFWGAASRYGQTGTSSERASVAGDDMLAELVAGHAQPLPPEAKDEHSVRDLERWVGVPVRPTPFERTGAHLVGGRVVPLRTQRAAMLQYLVGSGGDERRVSVIVYDAQKIKIGSALEPYPVGTAEVRVGREKGYSVAATQRDGVGYLVTSDLDTDKSAQLAALVYDDR
jgi:anti-sigma factor RsiW